jgi:hypothetical protein
MNTRHIARIIAISGLTLFAAACGKGGPAPGAGAPTAGLPAECESYVATVNACVTKVGGDNPAVASFRQQMESAKAEWAKIPDKATLAPTCKQMEDTFKQTAAAALKC